MLLLHSSGTSAIFLQFRQKRLLTTLYFRGLLFKILCVRFDKNMTHSILNSRTPLSLTAFFFTWFVSTAFVANPISISEGDLWFLVSSTCRWATLVCCVCWIQDGLLHKFLKQFLACILQIFIQETTSLVHQSGTSERMASRALAMYTKAYTFATSSGSFVAFMYSCEWCTCCMFALGLLQHMSNVPFNIWPNFYCSLSYLFIFHSSSSTEFQ